MTSVARLNQHETHLLIKALGGRFHTMNYTNRFEGYVDITPNNDWRVKSIFNTGFASPSPATGYIEVPIDTTTTVDRIVMKVDHYSSGIASVNPKPHNYDLNNYVQNTDVPCWVFVVRNDRTVQQYRNWLQRVARDKSYLHNSSEWLFNKGSPTGLDPEAGQRRYFNDFMNIRQPFGPTRPSRTSL